MSSKSMLAPLALPAVQVDDRFWSPRLKTNQEVTIPSIYGNLKSSGRLKMLACKKAPEDLPFMTFVWDSDIAKWMEAAAYSLQEKPDKKLEATLDRLVRQFGEMQQQDGYLNMYMTLVKSEKRWTDLMVKHELYSAGILMESAIAYLEATGKREFLDIVCRYADHIDKTFGPGKGQKRGVPGHQEIELALVKLYQVTGRERYMKLADFFVEERGRKPHYFNKERKGEPLPEWVPGWHAWAGLFSYYQAHLPIREQKTAEGHAVRLVYYLAGAVDVAVAKGDKSLMQACRRLWKNMTSKRMYVTGGLGSARDGEGFTTDYDLPNDTAYSETCAAIGLVFLAQRMVNVDKDSRYTDVMERALYNGVLSGISLDGKKAFYANLLENHPGQMKALYSDTVFPTTFSTRQEWFDCSCCPPNLARLLASLGKYIYSAGKNAAYVHLYIGGSGQFEFNGTEVTIEQKTEYPWKEKIRLEVRSEQATKFTLALRIPGWCQNAALKVNGRKVALDSLTRKGYAYIARTWAPGDKVDLVLPMPLERIQANPKVRRDVGRVALQRGPVVYCLEEKDNGSDLNSISLPRDARLTTKWSELLPGGFPVIQAKGIRCSQAGWGGDLYRPLSSAKDKFAKQLITAIPYCLWDNRGENEMLVWVRES